MTATNKGIETVDRAYVGGRYRRESYHRFWCINRALFSFGFACFFFSFVGEYLRYTNVDTHLAHNNRTANKRNNST